VIPDLESLRCFDAAATHLNFRAAARALAMSPTAFGDRIKRLEELLGVRLFERSTRRVELTEAGQRLREHARNCIEAAERCHEAVHGAEVGAPFELTVGTRFELGMSWLVPALDRLRDATPHRTLHLFFGDGPDLLKRLELGQLDCAIASVRVTSSDLQYAPIHEERYTFVAAPRTIAHAPVRGPDDALAHTLLDLHPDLPLFRYFIDGGPVPQPWRFGATAFLGTIAAVRYRVLEGAGIAVLPAYFVAEDLRARRLVELMAERPLLTDWFRLLWRTGHRRAPQLEALAAELRELPLR
jgi:LysR family glycine cleavage system transcriptional activator